MPEKKRDFKEATDAEWYEAERREKIIRPLAMIPVVGTSAAIDAAEELKLSQSQIYELISRYRENPVASSLIPNKRGRKKGSQYLSEDVEKVIATAIDKFFLTRQNDSATTALELVQIDHTLADIIVVDELYRQPIGRPWLTIAIDIASRMVAGLYVTLEKPSAVSVAMVIRNIVLPKEEWLQSRGVQAPWPVSGIPDCIHVDNAKEFRSKALSRGCREYGIDLKHRPVARPHYGGHIERLIGTMMGAVHILPGTTFSNIFEKGDYDSEKHAVMTMPEFETWLTIQVVGVYHTEIHRSLSLPPNEAWKETIAERKAKLRFPKDEAQFLLDFLPCEYRKVRRDGIRLFNIHYWDNILSVWAGQNDTPMAVKYDPRDLSQIYLQAPDGKHWPIRYRNLRRPKITLWEHKRAQKSLREKGRRFVDEQMIFNAVEAQRMLVAEAKIKSKKARLTSQRTSYAVDETPSDIEISFQEATHMGSALDESDDESIKLLPFEVEDWT